MYEQAPHPLRPAERRAKRPPHKGEVSRRLAIASAIALPHAGRGDARHVRVNDPTSFSERLHPCHADMKDDIRATHAVRLGLRQISGLSQAHALAIESVRGKGFDSVRDLWLRTRLAPSVLEKLAQADAFGSLGL